MNAWQRELKSFCCKNVAIRTYDEEVIRGRLVPYFGGAFKLHTLAEPFSRLVWPSNIMSICESMPDENKDLPFPENIALISALSYMRQKAVRITYIGGCSTGGVITKGVHRDSGGCEMVTLRSPKPGECYVGVDLKTIKKIERVTVEELLADAIS